MYNICLYLYECIWQDIILLYILRYLYLVIRCVNIKWKREEQLTFNIWKTRFRHAPEFLENREGRFTRYYMGSNFIGSFKSSTTHIRRIERKCKRERERKQAIYEGEREEILAYMKFDSPCGKDDVVPVIIDTSHRILHQTSNLLNKSAPINAITHAQRNIQGNTHSGQYKGHGVQPVKQRLVGYDQIIFI